MKQFLAIFLVVAFFKTTANSQTSNTGNVWIVAVNIYQYQDSILEDLNSAIKGAYEFSMLYETRQLTYSTPVILTDRRARRSDIIKALENTFVNNSELKSNDMILFYYSGHGGMAGDSIGICPYDYSGDTRDLITEQTIQNILRRSRARHKVCFIEACKNRVQSMEISDSRILERFNQQRRNVGDGLVFITSTKANEKSFIDPDIGGHFSHFLLRGLKGEADVDNDGFVTVGELFPFVRDSVKKLTKSQQIPQINEKGYDPSLPLMIVPTKLAPDKPKPVQEPCAINQTGEVCIENATRERIWVSWDGRKKQVSIPSGYKECLPDIKAGTFAIRVTNYAPGGGSYIPGGANDYTVQVKSCGTVTKTIR